MRIHLKGIHRVERRLANGTIRVHFYAWRGGPKINAEPGTPGFTQQYNEAHLSVRRPKAGTLITLIANFKASAEYRQLSPSSLRAYKTYIKLIEDEFGDLPLAALEDRRIRGEFKSWRDRFANTPRKADYAWSILSRILSFSKDRGLIVANPCEGGGRLYSVDRTDKVWRDEDVAALLATAAPRTGPGHDAGAMDWATARRPTASTLVRLRRQPHSPTPIQDGPTRHLAGRRAVENIARPYGAAQSDDPDHNPRQAVDIGWVSDIVGEGLQEGRHHRPHLS